MSVQDALTLLNELTNAFTDGGNLIGWTHSYSQKEYKRLRAARAVMEYAGFSSKTERYVESRGSDDEWRLSCWAPTNPTQVNSE